MLLPRDWLLSDNLLFIGVEAPTVVAMKHSTLWTIMPCSLVLVNRHLGGMYHLHHL
jgi:hypothetical protein